MSPVRDTTSLRIEQPHFMVNGFSHHVQRKPIEKIELCSLLVRDPLAAACCRGKNAENEKGGNSCAWRGLDGRSCLKSRDSSVFKGLGSDRSRPHHRAFTGCSTERLANDSQVIPNAQSKHIDHLHQGQGDDDPFQFAALPVVHDVLEQFEVFFQNDRALVDLPVAVFQVKRLFQ